jgi:hypothetical protein
MTMPHGPANINAAPVFHPMMWCLGDTACASTARTAHCAALFKGKRSTEAGLKQTRQFMRRGSSQNPREAEARRGAEGAYRR